MKTSLQILKFLKLVDSHDSKLSLTNIGLIIILVKIALVPQATVIDLGYLFLALLAYNAKKVLNQKTEVAARADADSHASLVQQVTELTANVEQRIEDVRSEVGKVQMSMGFKR